MKPIIPGLRVYGIDSLSYTQQYKCANAEQRADIMRRARLSLRIVRSVFHKPHGCKHVPCDSIQSEPAHTILRLRHTGWYADAIQDEVFHGVVGRLSHYRWIAGVVRYGESVWDTTRIFDTQREAARAADDMAQRDAEEAREYDERYQAAASARDALDEATDARECAVRAFRELWPLRRKCPMAIRSAVRELREATDALTDAAERAAEYSDVDL